MHYAKLLVFYYIEQRDTGSEQCIDEEGFYVGEKPKIASSHVKMMENRILKRKVKVNGCMA